MFSYLLFPDKSDKIVMHGQNVRPGQAFAGQKLKFTEHLSDDRLLFAGSNIKSKEYIKIKMK